MASGSGAHAPTASIPVAEQEPGWHSERGALFRSGGA